jgi:hypothetical protein
MCNFNKEDSLMKKVAWSMLVLSIATSLLVSCSAFQVKREVIDNTLMSNTPNVSIKVDPAYEYLGNPHTRDTSESVGGSELQVNFDSYCFVEPKENVASKALAVQFHRTQTYFVSDFFGDVEGLKKGKQELSGKSFQYFVESVHPSMNSHMTRLITDKGYTMPFGLLKVYGRVYGAKGNMLVKVFYYEPLKGSGLDDLSWNSYKNLSKNQRDYLEEFDKRADASFELVR